MCYNTYIDTSKQHKMDNVLTILIVLWLTNTSENANTAILSLEPTVSEVLSSNTTLCRLPPYPKRGGYVVLGQRGTGPGDAFSDVSLVQYTTDRDRRVFEIKRLSCSAGEWERDIFQYDGKALYFYTSWCPYFCSSFSSEQYAECSIPNIAEDFKNVPEFRATILTKHSNPNKVTSKLCRLPPYPNHGTYIVQDSPDARPGDTFQNVSLIQYTSDQHNKVVTIEHYKCSAGVWYQKIFQEASESLYFYSDWCPALCSQCFGEKLADRQHSLVSKNQAMKKKDQPKTNSKYCTIPVQPEFGNFSLISEKEATQPGDVYDALRLKFTCNEGYTLVGNENMYCIKGVWSGKLPKCTKSCRLNRQPGVLYFCGDMDVDEGSRSCGAHVQDGSVVTPLCNSPFYQSKSPLKPMVCENGEWDNAPDCKPVCGLIIHDEGRPLTDPRVRTPWHVAIFDKLFPPFQNKCGGSIVANNVVISGAACFITGGGYQTQSVNFFVVAGKLYQSWHQVNDDKTQLREIAAIKYSPWYTGVFSSYQHDIALVFLATPLIFNEYVWPVCLSFDKDLDGMQLTEGRLGTVAGWGRSDRGTSELRRVLELPNIDISRCINKAMNTQSRFGEEQLITSDKICAGYDTGTPLCEEDNGGGFVVAEPDPQDSRKSYHYLRGVVSLYNRNLCNEATFSVFTKVSAHENFIKSNSSDFILNT